MGLPAGEIPAAITPALELYEPDEQVESKAAKVPIGKWSGLCGRTTQRKSWQCWPSRNQARPAYVMFTGVQIAIAHAKRCRHSRTSAPPPNLLKIFAKRQALGVFLFAFVFAVRHNTSQQ